MGNGMKPLNILFWNQEPWQQDETAMHYAWFEHSEGCFWYVDEWMEICGFWDKRKENE